MGTPSAQERAAALVARMTLAEKLHLVHGHVDMAYEVPALPSLDIPALRMTDGPAGVNAGDDAASTPSTSLPSELALAATWNLDLVALQADVIARELRAAGRNVLLAPNLDVIRQPWWGRAAEQAGEDPYLISRIATTFIRGVQRHPVVATVKHLAAYTQETNRLEGGNVVVSDRALREVYLQPFHACVTEAGVGAVMSSFNNVNGTPAAEHRELISEILKTEWGFDGWVMSDYGSVTSTVAAVNAGFDQEMPGAGDSGYGTAACHFGAPLAEAVRSGAVAVARLDDMVTRIVGTMLRLGLFENRPLPEVSLQQHADVARDIATDAVTLLKNDGEALPLDGGQLSSIAVFGGDADTHSVSGGASLVRRPSHQTTVLQGIRERAAAARAVVRHVPATDPVGPTSMLPGQPPVPSSVLTTPRCAERGIEAEYWFNSDLQGEPDVVRVDAHVALSRGFLGQLMNGSPVAAPPGDPGAPLSARWSATLTAPSTGDYRFAVTVMGSVQVRLDGELIIDVPRSSAVQVVESSTRRLDRGRDYSLVVEYRADAHTNWLETGELRLGWTIPDGTTLPGIAEAVAVAREVDVAIVYAHPYESEQRDRYSLSLPHDQDALIAAVAAANPRTIVILASAGPVVMPWIDDVAAVVQLYQGGQEQGTAAARVLFGDVNPSGKLPITYPRAERDVPVANPWDARHDPTVVFGEDAFVGYRAYDAQGIEPLFCFGHGLSFTSFEYGDVMLQSAEHDPVEELLVSSDVANTGPRDGQEVVQLYVADQASPVPRPPKQLRGFAKVAIASGASARVDFRLDRSAWAYWDVDDRCWRVAPGRYDILLGSSSRDIRAQASVVIAGSLTYA